MFKVMAAWLKQRQKIVFIGLCMSCLAALFYLLIANRFRPLAWIVFIGTLTVFTGWLVCIFIQALQLHQRSQREWADLFRALEALHEQENMELLNLKVFLNGYIPLYAAWKDYQIDEDDLRLALIPMLEILRDVFPAPSDTRMSPIGMEFIARIKKLHDL